MAVKLISHQNSIGHEINESLENYTKDDREIFCKKLHKITEPNETDCNTCSYFKGWMQGHGIECEWIDVTEFKDEDERHIPHSEARYEYLRVSKLIDEGVIKKG